MIYKLNPDGHIRELTNDFVEHLYSEYLPENSLLIPDGVSNDLEIPDYVTHVVVDAATNPVLIDRDFGNFSVCSGFYSLHGTTQNRIKFFPFWALWMSHRSYDFSHQPKHYKISCLNGTCWEHRKLVYLLLSQKDYFDQIIFTYKHRPTVDGISELTLTSDEQHQLSILPQQLYFAKDDADVGIDLTIAHPAYQNAYVNLVTETVTDPNKPMLSEKTFKPIIAGQFFILVAAPGAVKFLRDIGIDTFDDIIDHSYDSITDTRHRINEAIRQVDILAKENLEDLYIRYLDRLKTNSYYFKSEEFRKQFSLTFKH